jgi:hypothetical protein
MSHPVKLLFESGYLSQNSRIREGLITFICRQNANMQDLVNLEREPLRGKAAVNEWTRLGMAGLESDCGEAGS